MSVFALLLCLLVPAYSSENLETIEVTAEKKTEEYTFSSSEKLEGEELERSPVPLASQVLERVPGLVSSQNGGPGGRTTFFIRGTEARHISFTLDGLKLNDPSNTDRQFDAAFLTLTAIAELSVHKGPQAILYGSDALGGHVEMITRKGSEKQEKKLTLTGGSFGTAGASYRHDWKSGALSLVRQRTDGISRFNKKRFDATERDGSEITQLTSSSAHRWNEKLKTDLLASFIEGRNELDLSGDSVKERSRNHQYLLQQKTRLNLSKHSALSLRNGLNRHERETKSLSGDDRFNGNLFQNELLWETGSEEARLISGLFVETETLRFRDRKDFTTSSAFLQGLLRDGAFTFKGGVRGDQHSKYGSFLASSAGVSLDARMGTFTFQYGRGFKAPSLYQLYGPATTFFPVVGNPDLKPESNQSYEAQWRKTLGAFEFENVFFQNRLSNLIDFSVTEGYLNRGRFIAEGVEPSVKWTGSEVQVRGSFTHQRFRETEVKVYRRPYNYGQLRTSLFLTDNSELFALGRWFDARKDRFFGRNIKVSSFETFDLGGVHRWKGQEVSLQILNVGNRDYEEIAGFSVMPRSLFGSYGITF